jgi:PAS domain S-box-containing protein
MKGLLFRRIPADSQLQEGIKEYRGKSIHYMLLYTVLMMSVGQIMNCITLPENLIRWLLYLLVIVITGLLLIYINLKGYNRVAAYLFICISIVITTTMAWTAGGLHSPVVHIYPLLVLMAGLILGWGVGILTGILIILFGLGFTLADIYGWLPESQVSHNSFSIWVSLSIIIILLIILQYYTVENLENALRRAQHEIENRRQIEKNLMKSESFRQRVFESSRIPIVIMDATTSLYIDCNQAAVSIYGYSSPGEVIGKCPLDFSATDQYDHTPSVIKVAEYIQLAGKKGSVIFEWLHKRPDGELWDAEVHLMSFDLDGRNLMQFTLMDISQKKRTEQRLRESEKRLRFISENTFDVIWVLDLRSGRFSYVSSSVEKLRGYSAEEVLQQSMEDSLTPESAKEVKALFAKVAKLGGQYRSNKLTTLFRLDQPCKNGSVVPTEVASTVIFNEEGIPIEVIGISRDISERLKVEKALKDSEARYRNLFESANDAIFILKDSRFIDCNTMATQLFYLPKSELVNLSPWDISPPLQSDNSLSKEKAMKKISDALRGNPQRFEWQHLRADKSIIEMEVSLNKIEVPGEELLLAVVRDISERKRFEKELYFSTFKGEENERARLAKDLHDGLGPLISACKIYHFNLNQPKFDTDEKESYQKLGELLNESMNTIREISNNLSPHILRNFGLIDALKNFIDKLRTKVLFELNFGPAPEKRYSEVIEVTLYRVLSELINNTLKYAGASKIKISIREELSELRVSYSDDGVGFDIDQGTSGPGGFGLQNIHSRIKSVGGSLFMESKKNKGVKIEVIINL